MIRIPGGISILKPIILIIARFPYNSDTVDQYKTSFTKTLTTNSKLVYTEPAGKKALLEINYVFSRISNSSDRKSFDKVNRKYDALNQLYSNQYGLNYLSNSAGLKYQYNGKKLIANIGTNVGVANYTQKDSSRKEVKHFRYTNLFLPISLPVPFYRYFQKEKTIQAYHKPEIQLCQQNPDLV